MKCMKIEIPIAPRSKKNSQRIVTVHGRPMILPSKLYKDYEVACKPYIPALEKPIDYPVNVKCLFFLPTRRRADLTNYLECCDDVLVKYKVLEDDNYNIIESHDGSRMYYCKEYPHTEIYIEPIKKD